MIVLGVFDRLGLLHLRDQRQARVLAHGFHVGGYAHERQRHHVHADRFAVAQQLEVLLGHGGQRVGGPGNVEPLARGNGAAHLDLGVDLACLGAHIARRAGAPSRRRGRAPPAGVSAAARPGQVIDMWRASPTLSSPQVNVTMSPGLSSTMSSRSGPIRSLGPGRSCRIATGRPALPGGVAHAAYGLLVLLERSVRVVQARHVHPGAHHREQRGGLARGGPDGGDDLCAAHRLRKVAGAAGVRGCPDVTLWSLSTSPPGGFSSQEGLTRHSSSAYSARYPVC